MTNPFHVGDFPLCCKRCHAPLVDGRASAYTCDSHYASDGHFVQSKYCKMAESNIDELEPQEPGRTPIKGDG